MQREMANEQLMLCNAWTFYDYLISFAPENISPLQLTSKLSFPSACRFATVPPVLFHYEADGQVPLSQDQEDSI